MSKLTESASYWFASAQRSICFSERGQATAEYGVVLLIAVALGMAVLMMFTGNVFDGVLTTLLKKVLQTAAGMINP